MMANLSPAAQAVLDAYIYVDCGTPSEAMIAAALRAAAKSLQSDPSSSSPLGALLSCQDQLYAIAAELESE